MQAYKPVFKNLIGSGLEKNIYKGRNIEDIQQPGLRLGEWAEGYRISVTLTIVYFVKHKMKSYR